jgi:hypothetical protein
MTIGAPLAAVQTMAQENDGVVAVFKIRGDDPRIYHCAHCASLHPHIHFCLVYLSV